MTNLNPKQPMFGGPVLKYKGEYGKQPMFGGPVLKFTIKDEVIDPKKEKKEKKERLEKLEISEVKKIAKENYGVSTANKNKDNIVDEILNTN